MIRTATHVPVAWWPLDYARATMTHQDPGNHRVFKIGELEKLITNQLVLDSPESGVNLACVFRYLEEPVLNTLWETQRSLYTS